MFGVSVGAAVNYFCNARIHNPIGTGIGATVSATGFQGDVNSRAMEVILSTGFSCFGNGIFFSVMSSSFFVPAIGNDFTIFDNERMSLVEKCEVRSDLGRAWAIQAWDHNPIVTTVTTCQRYKMLDNSKTCSNYQWDHTALVWARKNETMQEQFAKA